MSKKGATEVLKKHIWDDICRGANQSYLVEMIKTDGYDVGYTLNSPTAKDLIAKVRKQMKADWQEERDEMREVMIARLFDLFTEAKENNDRLTALKTLQEVNKIVGMYEPQKIDASVKASVDINFGFESTESDED